MVTVFGLFGQPNKFFFVQNSDCDRSQIKLFQVFMIGVHPVLITCHIWTTRSTAFTHPDHFDDASGDWIDKNWSKIILVANWSKLMTAKNWQKGILANKIWPRKITLTKTNRKSFLSKKLIAKDFAENFETKNEPPAGKKKIFQQLWKIN